MGKIVSKFCSCFGRDDKNKVYLSSSALRNFREEAEIVEITPCDSQSTISTCADFDELKNSLKYYLVYRNTYLA
jgi:hypothetical protein